MATTCRITRRPAFTLIEVSIVITIMAVLAATILPQFTSSADDARDSTLKHNIQVLRLQIELYKLNHKGGVPDGSNNLSQLTSATNEDGKTGQQGGEFRFGPYVTDLPANPYTLSAKVTLFLGAGTPSPSKTPDAGWIYNPTTGGIWCDDPTAIDKY